MQIIHTCPTKNYKILGISVLFCITCQIFEYAVCPARLEICAQFKKNKVIQSPKTVILVYEDLNIVTNQESSFVGNSSR
jgi:hypothetical protein